MKSAAITLAILAVMATAALAQSGDVGVPINPVGPGSSAPSVHLSARAVDIGIDIDGSGSSINPTDFRPGSYAFTGERIVYVVVVRDQNGAQDINLVKWVHDGDDEMGPCTDVTSAVLDATTNPSVSPSNAGYCFNTDRGDLLVDGVVEGTESNDHIVCHGEDVEKIEIDSSTNLLWDPQTDKLFKCVLTVESQWEGSEIQVVASDTAGDIGATLSENWEFNPALIVDVDTNDGEGLAFGIPILDQAVPFATEPNCVIDIGEDLTSRDCRAYIPDNYDEGEKLCDVSFSTNKVIVRNIGTTNLWSFIAATNFYATSGLAKCPFTNELSANQFEYRATSGSYDSGWRVMPQYSPNLQCAGIGIGDSSNPTNGFLGQCRGACRIPAGGPGDPDGGSNTNPPLPGLDILSPGHTIEVALKIVWPTPCIGTFDEGDIKIIVRAV